MTRHDPAMGGAGKQVGTCSNSTTHHRPVVGAVVVLVDPAGVAEQVLEKRGPSYCAELARELLAPLRVLRAEVAS